MKVFVFTFSLLMLGCSSNEIISIGHNEYMLEKIASGPEISGKKISAELFKEANNFCTQANKQFMMISLTERDNKPNVSFASSKIKFHCVVYKE